MNACPSPVPTAAAARRKEGEIRRDLEFYLGQRRRFDAMLVPGASERTVTLACYMLKRLTLKESEAAGRLAEVLAGRARGPAIG